MGSAAARWGTLSQGKEVTGRAVAVAAGLCMGALGACTGGAIRIPAAATCCGFDREGLPIAMQVVGAPRDDARVLRAAHAYERATPWRDRRPLP